MRVLPLTEEGCDGDDDRWRVLCGPSPDSAVVPSRGRHPVLLALAVPEEQDGGPTFGIDVKGEEILRFDAHGPRGHWHKGGYDKLGARGSHQDFPEGMADPVSQLAWSLGHLRTHAQELLAEAGHPAAAAALEPALLAAALDAVRAHVEQEGDLRTHAIAQGLLMA
jgi:hypothetical protein